MGAAYTLANAGFYPSFSYSQSVVLFAFLWLLVRLNICSCIYWPYFLELPIHILYPVFLVLCWFIRTWCTMHTYPLPGMYAATTFLQLLSFTLDWNLFVIKNFVLCKYIHFNSWFLALYHIWKGIPHLKIQNYSTMCSLKITFIRQARHCVCLVTCIISLKFYADIMR